MENPVVSGLRSRSRSKTPFLRSSCDREACADLEPDHTHRSGRKTPVKRSTPINQLSVVLERNIPEPIIIEDEGEVYTSPPAHRTRAAAAAVKTSDYSSEESPDRLRSTEQLQNKLNSQYEYSRVTSTSVSRRGFESGGTVADFALSPSQHSSPYNRSYNAGLHRSYSPAHSACSTDSSFAEQALADVSKVTERDHSYEHLPYKLYKMAGEYWNKYPKTDYTYSPLSRDRVELAPGQVAVPNMSRRSLSQFRAHGATTSAEELEQLLLQHNHAWTTGAAAGKQRKRSAANSDSSGDESPWRANGGYTPVQERWLLTRWLIAVYTSVTSSVSRTYDWMRGADRRYRYSDQQGKPGVASRAAWAVAAPLVWIYSMIRTFVTTTTTTITNTITGGNGGEAVARDAGYYRARAGSAAYAGARASRATVERSKWPWLLLLLLPLLGYACYNNGDFLTLFVKETNTSPLEGYVAPKIIQDPDLSRRLSVLEDWVGTVDARLRYFDEKLSKIDNLEAQIESYSIKHLQQNLVQIFNINGKDGKITSDELKEWFDRHYVSKNDLAVLAKDIRDRITVDAKTQLDEESIRKLIEEYLAVFESKQIVILKEKIRHYVREVRTVGGGGGDGGGDGGGGTLDEEGVRRIVGAMLNVYDADKTGVVDYALESAGGQVISTKCTELYQIKTKQYSILGLPVWWVYTSPRYALTPGAMPAECWAFQGFPGYLVVRTYAIIEVTGFSLEHMSRLLAADGKIESAPRNFSVYGLREELDPEPHLFGEYVYDENGTSIQHFPVQHPSTVNIAGKDYPMAYDTVELRVESNYGNPTYTCVYRFRVHGNPLTDIRRATEDSMRDE